MTMNAGDETVQAGTMARAIYDALEALVDPDVPVDEARKRAAAGIAQGVVAHLAAHAEVAVTITTSDSALQRASGVDTQAPSTDKTITGSLS